MNTSLKRKNYFKFLSSLVLAFFMTLSLSAFAHNDGDAPQKTFKGEIVDMACYMSHDGHGAKHKTCAMNCLKNGEPMGLLMPDGSVYLLTAEHGNMQVFDELKKKAAETVSVTGAVYKKGGVASLMVHSFK